MQRRTPAATRALLPAAATSTRSGGVPTGGVRGGAATAKRTEAAAAVAAPAPTATTATRPTAEQAVVKRKVDEILKRTLPHSIVQSYSKISAALKTQVTVAVNGELLRAVEREQGPLSAQWKAQQDTSAVGARKTAPSHPFHYARSIQYTTGQPELSLNETFKTLEVTVTSLSTGTAVSWFQTPSPVLTKKAWRLVAETDRKIGMALYELPLGPWGASTLVVLVWAKTLEVVNMYLQLHVAELLYGCPPRTIRILPDDVDTRYGLHSFTVAVTIRDFARVLWETECYSIECSAPDAAKEMVSASLLDEESGYRDRSRFISSAVATAIATDAISVGVESAIVVDVTVWEGSCQPVWASSKLLSTTTREAPREARDFSRSAVGDSLQLGEIVLNDALRGNVLRIHLEKPGKGSSSSATNKNVFVKQITLELSTAFINTTFGTNYPFKAKRKA